MAKIGDTFEKARKLAEAGQFERALKELRLIMVLVPGHVESRRLAAAILMRDMNRPDLALEHFEAVAKLSPDDPVALANYTGILSLLGRGAEAIAPLRAGLARFPGQLNLGDNLLALLVQSGMLAEAIELGRGILARGPENGVARRNLATALQDVGRIEDARRVLEGWVGPMPANVMAQYATLGNSVEAEPSDALLEAHVRFGKALGPGVSARPRSVVAGAQNVRASGIRIGFVSPDFRRHSVAYFIEPLLQRLHLAGAEVFVYMTATGDETTARLRQHRVRWRDLPGAPPAQLAGAIAADALDVVVELAGLTVGNPLAALALRPAPVQISYLGYPNTTGCAFMDFRIVDRWTDPPEATNSCVERLIRMEAPFVCFQAPEKLPPVAAGAADSPFTFGCFGAASKHSDALLELWRRVLEAAPGARLLLKSVGLRDPATLELVRGRLAGAGVPLDRVEHRPARGDYSEHLAMYNEVDLSLDTFPYHGTTTTCESLLMGVPMLTLAGRTHAARVGVSLLESAGRAGDVTLDADGFVAAAAARAAAGRLSAAERGRVRGSFLTSAVCDGAGFCERFHRAVVAAVSGATDR